MVQQLPCLVFDSLSVLFLVTMVENNDNAGDVEIDGRKNMN